MRPIATSFLLSLIAVTAVAQQGWYQWGRNGAHDSASPVVGQSLGRIEAEIVVDPHAADAQFATGGNLLIHYQVPLVDGADIYSVLKGGTFTNPATRDTQTWNVQNLRRTPAGVAQRWLYQSDWKPLPFGSGGPTWEPVYHLAVTDDAVWAPAAGGTLDKISRADGTRLARINPFGLSIDPTIFTAGPPSADAQGNIYYTAIRVAPAAPWSNDPLASWLVRIDRNGTSSVRTFTALVPNAPAADATTCTSQFPSGQLPWPPSPDAVAPTTRCGVQRPGVNIAPAIAPDGTVYVISRAHVNDRWGYLVAVNADLTPKWAASLRNRFNDGCNVLLPPNGTPGGCRAGAATGVSPDDNQPGSGRVTDNSTSSPVVTPDGNILYGAYTRYNYSQGHLMMFDANGNYLRAYPFGWDLTPAIWRHDGTYSVLLKQNQYGLGSYCGDGAHCPGDRTLNTPNDPEAYYISQLNPQLQLEWKFRNTETRSCGRRDDGTIECLDDHPNGFEWCVNAVAVDAAGIVYANAEDGYLYSIDQGGLLRQRLFLRLALGAAYTPLSIGPDGRIYTQNDGYLFIVGSLPKRRSAR
ncbi:MAG TPA: hypothetical protein VGF69_18590 [Thermoanaerobaculia bacterium]|jgi:hypothetical protein